MESIETARLIIRDFTPADARDLHEILGDGETMKYCEPPYDFEKTKAFLESFCIGRRGAVAAAEKQSQKLIGYILFNEFDPGVFEMGWIFNRSYWRQGYAYEACKAVMDDGFRVRNARRIFAETADQEKSVPLMKKLGMTFEGIEKNNGANLYRYGLPREEWEKAYMDYQIRPVTEDDSKTLAQIQTASWRSAFRGILTDEDLDRLTNVEKAANMYSRLLHEGKGHGYIGELNGKAHCIAWWDCSRDADMPGYAEIICIHSLPDNWRKGYGSQMMDRLLGDIQAAGFQKVMLWVFTDNHRARAFYEAKGFAAAGKVKPALGTTEVCYKKEL